MITKRLPGEMIGLYCLIFCNAVYAQTTPADSTLLSASLQNVINIHNNTLAENIHLYNGPMNIGYNHTSIGHPYFMADSVQIGSVFYDGIFYGDVSMLYDLEQDNVVILQYNTSEVSQEYKNIQRMDLIRPRVTRFSLPGHDFVRLVADSNSRSMRDGFYDRSYNGKTKVFVKYTKKFVEEVRSLELEKRYDAFTFYYIQKSGIYHNVKNKKSVLRLFNSKRKELKSYIRKKKLKFKRNQEPFIIEISRYYDQLTNQYE